jgi:hypothetical protein
MCVEFTFITESDAFMLFQCMKKVSYLGRPGGIFFRPLGQVYKIDKIGPVLWFLIKSAWFSFKNYLVFNKNQN